MNTVAIQNLIQSDLFADKFFCVCGIIGIFFMVGLAIFCIDSVARGFLELCDLIVKRFRKDKK